jgi:hypothetical protein
VRRLGTPIEFSPEYRAAYLDLHVGYYLDGLDTQAQLRAAHTHVRWLRQAEYISDALHQADEAERFARLRKELGA